MHKTGGVIGIIAGVFAVIAALVTLVFGGVASAFHAEKAGTVVGLGWGGIAFSFLVIVFAAVSLSKFRFAGWGLIASAILGAILGGTLVAIFMILALIGGILVVAGTKANASASGDVAASSVGTQSRGKAGVIAASIAALLVIGSIVAVALKPKDQAVPEEASQTAAPTVVGTPQDGVVTSAADLAKLALADVNGPEANKLTELGAAPPENQVAAFMRLSGTEKPTDAQLAARTKAVLDAMSKARGTVVVWEVVIDNVKAANGGVFKVTTKCSDLANQVTPPAQVQMAQPDTDIVLSTRNADELRAVESLAGCAVIKVKGIVASFDGTTKKIELRPAILVSAGTYNASDVNTSMKGTAAEPVVNSEPTVAAKAFIESNEKEATLAARSVPESGSNESDSDRLRIVDAELNKVYGNLMKTLPAQKRTELKQTEQTWVKNKEDVCKHDQKCLLRFTEERLVELSKM